MLHLATIAVANFAFIGLKAFQQLNVVNHDLKMVFLTSNMLAAVEVWLIATYAHKGAGLPLIITVGISGGLGCLFAMKFRKWLGRTEVR